MKKREKGNITIIILIIVSILILLGMDYFVFTEQEPEIIKETKIIEVCEGIFPEMPFEDYLVYSNSWSVPSNKIIDCKGKEINQIIFNKLGAGIFIGDDKENITIQNCNIKIDNNFQEASFGIYIYSPKGKTNNIKLLNNKIEITGGFRVRGILIYGGNNIEVSGNEILVVGERVYGVRTQAENWDINILNNTIRSEVIDGGQFVTPIETSNWIGKYAYNILIEGNEIFCISNNVNEHYGMYIADTKDSKVINNIIHTSECSPARSIRSSKVEFWNNQEIPL